MKSFSLPGHEQSSLLTYGHCTKRALLTSAPFCCSDVLLSFARTYFEQNEP